MTAAEIKEGIARLGVLHETTPPYTPAANGKIETLWASVDGRLIAMLEGVPDLTLAWAEQDYNRKLHSEIGVAPIARFLEGQRSVLKPLTGMSGISDGADHAIAMQKVTDPVFSASFTVAVKCRNLRRFACVDMPAGVSAACRTVAARKAYSGPFRAHRD